MTLAAALEHVRAALRGALASRPKLSRRAFVRWARAEARAQTGARRLSPEACRQIDHLVTTAIEEAARTT